MEERNSGKSLDLATEMVQYVGVTILGPKEAWFLGPVDSSLEATMPLGRVIGLSLKPCRGDPGTQALTNHAPPTLPSVFLVQLEVPGGHRSPWRLSVKGQPSRTQERGEEGGEQIARQEWKSTQEIRLWASE